MKIIYSRGFCTDIRAKYNQQYFIGKNKDLPTLALGNFDQK